MTGSQQSKPKPKPKPSPKKGSQTAGKDGAGRKIIYKSVFTTLCRREDDTALTADDARKTLGWTTSAEAGKKAGAIAPMGRLPDGTEVWATNNTINRPFVPSWGEVLAHEILNGNWEFNGESIVIGETGQVISGQHRLFGVALADHLLGTVGKTHPWRKRWPEGVSIDCLMVYGVSEDDRVINTVDTGRRRSLADMLYRSDLLNGFQPKARKVAAKNLEYAVRLLWERTGLKDNGDAYAVYQSHAEVAKFVRSHPRVLDAVKHITEEYAANQQANSRRMSPGSAAGFLYLMAASGTDGETYRKKGRTEEHVDLKWWEKACEFWTLMCANAKELMEVRHAIGSLVPEDGVVGLTSSSFPREKAAIIVKAWNVYSTSGKVNADDLNLVTVTDEDGDAHLAENPSVGGIDLGFRQVVKDDDEDEEDTAEAEDTDSVDAKQAAAEAEAEATRQALKGLRNDHLNRILLVVNPSLPRFSAFEHDAVTLGKLFKKKVTEVGGLPRITFDLESLDDVVERLTKAKLKCARVDRDDSDPKVPVGQRKPLVKYLPVEPSTNGKHSHKHDGKVVLPADTVHAKPAGK